jgi:hypothetical protein
MHQIPLDLVSPNGAQRENGDRYGLSGHSMPDPSTGWSMCILDYEVALIWRVCGHLYDERVLAQFMMT